MDWPELTTAIEEFRKVRSRTLEIASASSAIHRRPRPGTWSMAQVLDHLLRTELVFRKYQRQALERAKTGQPGTIQISFLDVDTRLRPLPAAWMPLLAPVLRGMNTVVPFGLRLAVMRTRGIVWAAAPTAALPAEDRTLASVRADLQSQIQETAGLFQCDLPGVLPQVSVAHPLYGSNDVSQMFRLMGAHEERHQHQLLAILKH